MASHPTDRIVRLFEEHFGRPPRASVEMKGDGSSRRYFRLVDDDWNTAIGAIGPDRVFSGDDQRRDNPRFSVANRQKAKDFAEAIRPVAERHGASIAQVVIAWTLAQPGVTFALCGARNPAQALDNARAGTLRLGTEDIAAIDAAIAAKLASMDG